MVGIKKIGRDAQRLLIVAAALSRSGADVVVKYKVVPALEANEAVAIGIEAGLQGVRRSFRSSGKHESNHVAAGLDLWYQAITASSEDANDALLYLRARDFVESAEIESQVGFCS